NLSRLFVEFRGDQRSLERAASQVTLQILFDLLDGFTVDFAKYRNRVLPVGKRAQKVAELGAVFGAEVQHVGQGPAFVVQVAGLVLLVVVGRSVIGGVNSGERNSLSVE